MSSPLVGIGIPAYNRAGYFREAIESLLAQTIDDIAFVVVDDCSSDETPALAERYASLDPRLTVVRNDRRVGMIENWQRAYELVKDRAPGLRYFAWGSDHDVWHPLWVEVLLEELEEHPEAVLAYPRNVRISDAGHVVRGPWDFSTAGVAAPAARFVAAVRRQSAGNMIYGLFRAPALERAGVVPRTLAFDRLLLSQAALFGQFRQVDAILWRRRFTLSVTNARQRRSLFAGRPPLATRVPWSLPHAAILFRRLVVGGVGRPEVGRLEALGLSAFYLAHSTYAIARTSARKARKRLRRAWRHSAARRAAAGLRRRARGRLRLG